MKKTLIKLVIILSVFVAALFIISGIMNKGNTDMTAEMPAAEYPVVTMLYDGREVNTLHGYARTMEVNYMRGSLTPLSSGRGVSLVIDCYESEILDITYEVRSLDGQRLIESTEAADFEEADGRIALSFHLKDLIESDQEYMLVLVLHTAGGAELRYYTRVIASEELNTEEKLDYVLDFSEKTFDKEQARDLIRYLEINSEGDNTTLGKVTIHSSFNQVTWGDLAVTRLTEPEITIRELAGATGSFQLAYYVTTGSGSSLTYYRIEEFYRVRYTADRMYLLDFERTMNQMFDDKGDVFGSNTIYLGITGDEVPLMESDGGNIIAFVTGNRLYSYNVVDHKLAYLYGFYDENNADERTLYDAHRIKILNVDEGGNVTFLVYGYMNRGHHEGQVGILAGYYDSTVNTTEELLYVPYDKSPELLLAEVEELSYINRDGTLYLMLDNNIYGISAMNRSYEIVARDLKEGCYQVSDSNKMVVWQKENELYQGTELILMNLNTGEQTIIAAGSGEVISPIGFMGEDLIYGIAKRADMVQDQTGSVILPMYCVRIQNETEGVLKEYQEDGIYVTEGTVQGNQIILKRVAKEEEGLYQELEEDQIVNTAEADTTRNTVSTVAIDLYEKVTQITLKQEISSAAAILLTPREVMFEGGRDIVIEEQETENRRYYVYGKNGVEGIFMDVGNAVNLADESSGVVISDAGAYVWLRGTRNTRNQIMAITGEEQTEERSSLAVCLDTMLTYEGISRNTEYLLASGETPVSILEENLDQCQILDLSGCSLSAVLYYVDQDIPVLVMMEDGSAVLLIGFNEMNTVIMNPETGTVYKVGMNDSEEWFEQNGNRFITYIRPES